METNTGLASMKPEKEGKKWMEFLKENKNEYVDPKDELKKLEQKWLDELQPYDERGYHKKM